PEIRRLRTRLDWRADGRARGGAGRGVDVASVQDFRMRPDGGRTGIEHALHRYGGLERLVRRGAWNPRRPGAPLAGPGFGGVCGLPRGIRAPRRPGGLRAAPGPKSRRGEAGGPGQAAEELRPRPRPLSDPVRHADEPRPGAKFAHVGADAEAARLACATGGPRGRGADPQR